MLSAPLPSAPLTSGHQLIASIAQTLLTPLTAQSLAQILSPQPLDLALLAPWADRIKHTNAYYWSRTLHYINPVSDHPPQACTDGFAQVVTPDRTLLKAIANYTVRLGDDGLDRWGKEEALRFLVHFMGDAEQPLHCSPSPRRTMLMGSDWTRAWGE
jgi:nuclease S1